MSPRPFNELVAIFPDLGELGTLPEAQAYNIPSVIAGQLSTAHSSYSTQLQAAIQFWTGNNKKILPFMDDEDRLGNTAAFNKLLAARSKWLSDSGHSQTPDIDGRNYANLVKHHADQLRLTSHRLPFGSNLIFRGEAIDSLRVGIDYAVGRRIPYPLPRSFTIEPEFIPLHFAWKQWNCLAEQGVSPAALILEVELHSDQDTPLLWASEAPPTHGRSDMRWQKEIITGAGLEIEIVSCDLITGASVPLYRAKAIEIRT